jgi:hypothetical protein
MSNEPIKTISYTHDAMIDAIIAKPAITQRELGAMFGYSGGWVSIIMSSDVFKARLAERRKELIDPSLVATVEEQLEGLARSSMQVLQKELERPGADPDVALKALATSTKALGMGKDNGQPTGRAPSLSVLADNITLVFRQQQERIINGEATFIEGDERANASDSGEADEAEI